MVINSFDFLNSFSENVQPNIAKSFKLHFYLLKETVSSLDFHCLLQTFGILLINFLVFLF